MSVFSFHTTVVLLYQFLKIETFERILTLLYSYKWKKFSKMNEKSLGYQSEGTEYVTGQINSLILRLLLRRFYRLIFVPSRKS